MGISGFAHVALKMLSSQKIEPYALKMIKSITSGEIIEISDVLDYF